MFFEFVKDVTWECKISIEHFDCYDAKNSMVVTGDRRPLGVNKHGVLHETTARSYCYTLLSKW